MENGYESGGDEDEGVALPVVTKKKKLKRGSLTLDEENIEQLDQTIESDPIGLVRNQSLLNKARKSATSLSKETKKALQSWIKRGKRSLKEKSLDFKELKLIDNSSFNAAKTFKKHLPVPTNDKPSKLKRRMS